MMNKISVDVPLDAQLVIVDSYIDDYNITNPVSTTQACNDTKLSARVLRRCVSDLRVKGIPICSDNRGYYKAKKKDDLIATLEHLIDRRNKLNDVIIGLKKAKDSLCDIDYQIEDEIDIDELLDRL